jgi:hypothetical protein
MNELQRSADFLFILSEAHRLIDDADVDQMFSKSVRIRGVEKTFLILTKFDVSKNIVPNLSTSVTDESRTQAYYPEAHTEFGHNMKRPDQKDPFPLVKLCWEEAGERRDNRSRIQQYHNYLAQRGVLYLKQERVAQIKEDFLQHHKGLAPLAANVIPVSAFEYAAWFSEYRAQDPLLSPEETGIPHLRQKMLLLTANDNFENLRVHVEITMRNTGDQGGRILKKSHDKDNYAQKCQDLVSTKVPEMLDSLRWILKTDVLPIPQIFSTQGEKQDALHRIRDVVNSWRRTPNGVVLHQSFTKTMRDNGIVVGSTAAAYAGLPINWNDDLLQSIIDSLENHFAILEVRVASGCKSTNECIGRLQKVVSKHIHNSSGNGSIIERTVEEWEKTVDATARSCQKFHDRLITKVRQMHIYSTTEEVVGCLIARLNRGIYLQVSRIRGERKVDRQVRDLKNLLAGQGNNGHNLLDRIQTDITRRFQPRLVTLVEEFISDIERDLKEFVRNIDELILKEERRYIEQKISRDRLSTALVRFEVGFNILQGVLRPKSSRKRPVLTEEVEKGSPSKKQRV